MTEMQLSVPSLWLWSTKQIKFCTDLKKITAKKNIYMCLTIILSSTEVFSIVFYVTIGWYRILADLWQWYESFEISIQMGTLQRGKLRLEVGSAQLYRIYLYNIILQFPFSETRRSKPVRKVLHGSMKICFAQGWHGRAWVSCTEPLR